jgi:hypothetical protein
MVAVGYYTNYSGHQILYGEIKSAHNDDENSTWTFQNENGETYLLRTRDIMWIVPYEESLADKSERFLNTK